jgi:pimeloyl-ACP methyl ester carboxylesterase
MMQQTAMKRGYVDAPWGQIHYRQAGSGPAVLLYPNRPRSSVIYSRLAGLLAAHCRVLIIDPPGFGGSDPLTPPFEVPDLTRAVITLLDELGVDTVRMSGHHTGATICVDLAATHPERVAAIAPSALLLLTDEERKGRLDHTLKAPAYGNTPQENGAHLLPLLKKFPPTPPEDMGFVNDWIIDGLVSEPHQVPSADAVYRYPERDFLVQVTAPTLFFQSTGPGEPPTLQRMQPLVDVVPGSRIYLVDGGDVHFIHHRAEEMAPVLLDFFATADSSAPAS